MKKLIQVLTLFVVVSASIFSCKKDEKKATTTPTPESPYYFDFSFGADRARFACPEGHYSYFLGEVGGFQQPSTTVYYPSIELSFIFNRQATDADVLGLAGNRYRFNSWGNPDETTVFMSYHPSLGADQMLDTDDSSWSYYVAVEKVSFVKIDTVLGTALDIYEIKGTCKTMLEDDPGTTKKLLEGSFNMLIGRVKR